jgi:hypothetical protein
MWKVVRSARKPRPENFRQLIAAFYSVGYIRHLA